MMPSTTQLLTGGGCLLLILGGILLLGALGSTHMSRRDSADDIGPDVEEQEPSQGIDRLLAEGRIEDVFGYRDGRQP